MGKKAEKWKPVYKEMLAIVSEDFPHLFNKEFPRPLALGIWRMLVDHYKGDDRITGRKLKKLLFMWTNRREYHSECSRVGLRWRLDGSTEQMSDEHREFHTGRTKQIHTRYEDLLRKREAKKVERKQERLDKIERKREAKRLKREAA